MNHHIQSGGMTALLAALLTAQWFSSSTEGFLDACGNAVWLPVLVGGLALAGLILTLAWITAPRWLTAGIYIFMGWMGAAALAPLSRSLSAAGFF